MEQRGEEAHITTTEARGGETPHIVRYVLVIGLLLAVAAMTLIWVTGALNADQPTEGSVVSGQAVPRE